jgi:hypothetical protein
MAKVTITIEDSGLDGVVDSTVEFSPTITAAQMNGDEPLTDAQMTAMGMIEWLMGTGDVQNLKAS